MLRFDIVRCVFLLFYVLMKHYFKNIFHPFLSAFRPGFGCNTALLKIIEDWKKPLIVISIQRTSTPLVVY
jgi:hypothetical protein